jgi:hypothetical protein
VENSTTVYIPHLETQEDFWEVIRTLQNVILAGSDLFISTPPSLANSQSKNPKKKVLFLLIILGNSSSSSSSVSSG